MLNDSATQPTQLVEFFVHPKPVEINGKQQHIDAIYVRVTNKANDVPTMEATPEHFAKFPRQWERFQQTDDFKRYSSTDEEKKPFTPLDSICGPALAANLRDAGVRSVEDLKVATLDKIGHIRGIKQAIERAKAA